jgi:hypothetical protein
VTRMPERMGVRGRGTHVVLGETTRRTASRLIQPDYEHPIAIGCTRRWSEAAMLRVTQRGDNDSGNPGADTRHRRTALDEMGPAPEQPGWFWAGPVERHRSDSQSEGRGFESLLGLHFRRLNGIKQDERIRVDKAVAT